jgi:hypothetical protein
MSTIWLLIAKACALFLIAHVAIEALSRYKAGDTSDPTNHRRGWWLVAVMTVAALGLAMVG